MIQITHYIDRQFGHPIHIGTEDGVIKFVPPFDSSLKTKNILTGRTIVFSNDDDGANERFRQKLFENLNGKTPEDADSLLKKTFRDKGVYMLLKRFPSPLKNKIEDYE